MEEQLEKKNKREERKRQTPKPPSVVDTWGYGDKSTPFWLKLAEKQLDHKRDLEDQKWSQSFNENVKTLLDELLRKKRYAQTCNHYAEAQVLQHLQCFENELIEKVIEGRAEAEREKLDLEDEISKEIHQAFVNKNDESPFFYRESDSVLARQQLDNTLRYFSRTAEVEQRQKNLMVAEVEHKSLRRKRIKRIKELKEAHKESDRWINDAIQLRADKLELQKHLKEKKILKRKQEILEEEERKHSIKSSKGLLKLVLLRGRGLFHIPKNSNCRVVVSLRYDSEHLPNVEMCSSFFGTDKKPNFDEKFEVIVSHAHLQKLQIRVEMPTVRQAMVIQNQKYFSQKKAKAQLAKEDINRKEVQDPNFCNEVIDSSKSKQMPSTSTHNAIPILGHSSYSLREIQNRPNTDVEHSFRITRDESSSGKSKSLGFIQCRLTFDPTENKGGENASTLAGIVTEKGV